MMTWLLVIFFGLGLMLDSTRWLRWRRLEKNLNTTQSRPLPLHLTVWIILGLGVLAFMAKPEGFNSPAPETSGTSKLKILILLDASWSMTAGDRWQQASRSLEDILDRAPAHWPIGLVTFAGSADPTCPPTLDRSTLRHFLAFRAPNMMPDPGSLIRPALAEAQERLGENLSPTLNKKHQGGSGLAIIIVSDGEWEDKAGPAPFSTMALQIGNSQGEPLILPGGEPLESFAQPQTLADLTSGGPVLIPGSNPAWLDDTMTWLEKQASLDQQDQNLALETAGLARPLLAMLVLGLFLVFRFTGESERPLP